MRTVNPHGLIRSLLDNRKPLGENARAYLRKRGITEIKGLREVHECITTAGRENKWVRCKAIVAAVTHLPTGSVATVVATFLTGSDRLVSNESQIVVAPIKPLSDPCAARLFHAIDTLAIAQGIETAMAVRQIHGVPCWAVLSPDGIRAFVPPEKIKTLTVFHEDDEDSISAAHELAARTGATVSVAPVGAWTGS